MYCKSRRTRPNHLVRKTIRSRTARTGNPSRFPCIGWPTAWPRSTTKEAESHQELCWLLCKSSSQKKRLRQSYFSIKKKERKWTRSKQSCTVNKHWPHRTHGHWRIGSVQSWSRTQNKRNVILHMRSTSAGIVSRKDKNVKRNNGASDDSLERFAVANQDKSSDKAPSVQKVKNTKTRSIILRNAPKNFESCAETWSALSTRSVRKKKHLNSCKRSTVVSYVSTQSWRVCRRVIHIRGKVKDVQEDTRCVATCHARQETHRGKKHICHAIPRRQKNILEETLSHTQASPSRWPLTPHPENLTTSEERQLQRRREKLPQNFHGCVQRKIFWCDILSMPNKQTSQLIKKEMHNRRFKTASQRDEHRLNLRFFINGCEESTAAPMPINKCTGRLENTGRRLFQKE